MSDFERTAISLPAKLLSFARNKGQGNTSAYVAGLIEEDRLRDQRLTSLAEHGYVGDLAPTEAGVEAARQRLDEARQVRAAGRRDTRGLAA